jgi:hypothetical protein
MITPDGSYYLFNLMANRWEPTERADHPLSDYFIRPSAGQLAAEAAAFSAHHGPADYGDLVYPPGVDLDANAAYARQLRALYPDGPDGEAEFLVAWTTLVRPYGQWDYKHTVVPEYDEEYTPFGNYNFGYAGIAAGIPPEVLLASAGAANVSFGTAANAAAEGDALLHLHVVPSEAPPARMLGGAQYGDSPADQYWIHRGIEDAQARYGGR